MPNKMKFFPSIFKNKQVKHPSQWPSCKHPRTLSFRGHDFRCDDQYPTTTQVGLAPEEEEAAPSLEVVVRGVRRSERLFFEPEETRSMVRGSYKCRRRAFKDSMAMKSEDPYVDFKRSMEEMVEREGEGLLKDWDGLEELLVWYLRMNGKVNHGFIVGAFVDLVEGLAAVDSKKKMTTLMVVSDSMSTTTTHYSSASSSLISSPSSPLSSSSSHL